MLKIHQPYKSKYIFAFASIGALLLGSVMIIKSISEKSIVYAAGDSRTIHDITNMQDMTQQVCTNTTEGDTAVLTDSRDNNTYVVYKASDNNCWMGENLRLTGSKTLTPDDSDVKSNWTLPFSGSGNMSSNNTVAQIRTGNANLADWKNGYGNYYSWCAATAESCKKDRTGFAISGGDATESICPKGWKLPANSDVGSFQNLSNAYNSSWKTGQTINGTSDIRGYYFGYNSTSLAQGANFWPAAGSFDYLDGFHYAGNYGSYWSRTAYSNTMAYHLHFTSANVNSQNSNKRFVGQSIHCIALGSDKPTWSETEDGSVNVTMPTIITIDAASGMQDTAESNKITEGTIIAKVTSNGEHEVLLSALEPSLIDPKVPTAEVSPVSSTNPVQPGNNAWGIWNRTTSTYDPITKEAKTYDETITDSVDGQKVHTYQVGISISPALPAGTYATEVTVTAVAK